MYKNLYKQTIDNTKLQAARRRELLNEQKQKRALLQDEHRDLEAIVSLAKQNITIETKKQYNKRFFKDFYRTDHALQQSEWLRECPENLCDWLLVACPKGQRSMVVACNGRTEMYNKDGRIQMRFHSLLPGDGNGRNTITMLDCIYVKQQNTFYILDALAFGNQDLVHCEAQFRFFWIRSKLAEFEVSVLSDRNEKQFIFLSQNDFEDAERISEVLLKYPIWSDNNPELDGFLFYHKEANYTCGTTPLVGWLFPFMITEMLGYEVSPAYERPSNYVNCVNYMTIFDAKLSKKRMKKRIQSGEDRMEDEDCVEDEDASLKLLLKAQKNLELEGDCMCLTVDSDCLGVESRSCTC